jgi:hypothetical protein
MQRCGTGRKEADQREVKRGGGRSTSASSERGAVMRCGGADGSGGIFWLIFKRRGVIIGRNYGVKLMQIGSLT